MRDFFTFTGLLLVVIFVKNISGELYPVTIGSSPVLSAPNNDESFLECIVERNGVNYSTYPESNSTEIRHYGRRSSCSFTIEKLSFHHAGEWKINSFWKLNETDDADIVSNQTTHFIRVIENQKLLPTSNIESNDGLYATVYFQNYFSNITKCYISTNHYHKYESYVLSDDGNGTSVGLEMYNKCGVRIPINKKWSGNWELIQESGDYKLKRGSFQLSLNSQYHVAKENIKYWYRGSSVEISIESYSNVFCEVEKPDGEIIPMKNTECAYRVKKVTDKHAGTWKIRYIPKYGMNIMEEVTIVDVIDSEAINVTVMKNVDGMIHMLCKTTRATIDSCFFTMPNGTTISLIPGVGNNKYEYYGTGFNSIRQLDFAECGLTILQPSEDDYGLWKCHIRVKDTAELISTYVSTDNLMEKKVKHPNVILKNNVYVKRGDNFSIKCKINKSLDYCWLQSPNGTNYSVTKSRNTPNSLPYVGEGLSVGVCGASIENADDTHAGEWSCRLGVVGDTEIESIVPVTVTDSYIMPVQKTINVAHNAPTMNVKILPDIDETIQYCRWVRPNGHGFLNEDKAKYIRSQNKTDCTLDIRDWSTDDIGTWGCYARLSNGQDDEHYIRIKIVYGTQASSNIMWTIFVVSICTITVIVGIVFAIVFVKKRMANGVNAPMCFNEFDTSKHYPIGVTEKINL